MSQQTGSIILYICALLMLMLGVSRFRQGVRGRSYLNFFMAFLFVIWGIAISLGSQ